MSIECRLPGCDTWFHDFDGSHVADVGKLPLPGGLIAELDVEEDKPIALCILSEDGWETETRRYTDPAEVYALAARLRQFTEAVEKAADTMTQYVRGEPAEASKQPA
ncbi:hypothetical protein [Streptomyces violaceusniger]|uniref:hypothetical protein n=1 Tax=Streptomyces violaceusniger TaxID=68280 RepID=UPI0036CE6352